MEFTAEFTSVHPKKSYSSLENINCNLEPGIKSFHAAHISKKMGLMYH